MMKKFLLLVFLLLALSSVFQCVDHDGDGFDTDPANGEYQDCCDSVLDGCHDPYLVNPGAFEIPNNGQNDRCVYSGCPSPGGIKCQALFAENLPCDGLVGGEIYVLSGQTITSADTEPTAWAIDICEWKDDDDDPSWGYARQDDVVFALADQTRNGFDIGVIGPDTRQASILESFGRITPYNGKYMLVMSDGIAQAQFQPSPATGNTNFVSQGLSQTVNLPTSWSGVDGDSVNFGASGCSKPTVAYDSILSKFTVVHPTNMNAFSLKVLYLDNEISDATAFSAQDCTTSQRQSWFLAFKNGTTGIPADGNFAIDSNNYAINSFNPNLNFYTQCSNWIGTWPDNTCYLSEVKLDGTAFNYATSWIPFGTSALPGEVYQLQLLTFDQTDGDTDTAFIIDDFKVISEARTTVSSGAPSGYIQKPYGYQYTADLHLVSIIPNIDGLYPATTTSVTLNFVIRNEGPEYAGDVTISFTPPWGTAFASSVNFTSLAFKKTATAPYADNSFYKYKLPNNTPLAPHALYYGSVTFSVKSTAPKNLPFRITATTSSIDTIWGNNHFDQIIYINK